MPEEKDPRKIRFATQKKVMDLLARRDHSEKELRKKLRERFPDDEDTLNAIENAIQFAKDNNWLGDPQDLAQRMADMLHRKNKGIQYINNYLRDKGLPQVAPDREAELEKALEIVKGKYDLEEKLTREDKAKVGRFLMSRGFDSETVRKVIYEKL